MEMDQERMIMTVNGPISKEKFGLVLPHEHIFHSIGNSILTARKLSDKAMDTLQIEDLQEYRTNPSAFNGINLFLNSEDTAFRELQEVEKENPSKQFLVVDVTVRQEVEERTKLYNLSQRLNGDFITVTSCEFPQTKPEMNQNEEALRLAKTLETELLFGTNNIRAGAIYQQIHVLNSTLDTKHKLLAQVLALASSNTWAPVFLSFSLQTGLTMDQYQHFILDFLISMKAFEAIMNRLILCHADLWSETEQGYNFLKSVCTQFDVNVLFDMIGLYATSDVVLINPTTSDNNSTLSYGMDPPRDRFISSCVARLVADHLTNQILLSCGILQKIQLRIYGGGGYAYLYRHFKNRLFCEASTQISNQEWYQMTVGTPLQLLSFYLPPEKPPVPKNYLKCSICTKDFEPIVGEYFTKFEFIYCGTKCLRKHSRTGFAKLPLTS